MDQNKKVNNINEEMNQRMSEIPKPYGTQYGYAPMAEDQMRSPIQLYPNNQYIMQGMGHEQMNTHYVEGMDPAYICNYPMYEAAIPINGSIQQYRQSPYQSIASYEISRPDSRALCNGNVEYREHPRFQNNNTNAGKPTHRQKRNFLCC